MKQFRSIPLYLGFVSLILAVLTVSVQLGTKQPFSGGVIQAQQPHAVLSLRFDLPDLVSVLVSSEKEIGGVDISLGFEKDKIRILPSTLMAGSQFTTLGAGIIDAGGTFQFSALPKSSGQLNGIVGQFRIQKVTDGRISTKLTFHTGPDTSSVLDTSTLTNILSSADPLTFTVVTP